MSLFVIQFINHPITSNCFLVFDNEEKDGCIIIDPGTADDKELVERIENLKLKPEYIILTHEHFDHCWGVNVLRKQFDVKLLCSKECSDRIQSSKKNLSLFHDQIGFAIEKADVIVSGGSVLDWHAKNIKFFDSKGHTDSSLSIQINECLFTGDALIKNQATVTKLLTGSKEEQKKTNNFFYSLKGKSIKIYPGHGEIFDLDSCNFNNEKSNNNSNRGGSR